MGQGVWAQDTERGGALRRGISSARPGPWWVCSRVSPRLLEPFVGELRSRVKVKVGYRVRAVLCVLHLACLSFPPPFVLARPPLGAFYFDYYDLSKGRFGCGSSRWRPCPMSVVLVCHPTCLSRSATICARTAALGSLCVTVKWARS